MQLTDLRRWHWIVLGALLGLIIGYTLNAVGTDALETGSRASKTSQTTFESEIVGTPLTGSDGKPKPIIADLTIYPDRAGTQEINLLKFQRLVNDDPEMGMGSKKWEYQTWFYYAPLPYSPMASRDTGVRPTEVWIKPDIATDGYQGDDNWQNAEGDGKGYRDPGASGAGLVLNIGKADYDVAMILGNPKQAADLTAKFEDHPLAPFTVDQSNPLWVHTTIPAKDFGGDNSRVLWLRKGAPVQIKRIHIFNPTYTVLDYLKGLQAERGANGQPRYPDLHFRYAWWMEPKSVLWLSIGGCVLVIGIIWPTVLGILVGAGYGPPQREKRPSFRHLKATPVAVPVSKAPTDDDLASLEEMEQTLLNSLEADAAYYPPAAPVATATAAPAPPRAFTAKPIEPPAPPPKKDEDHKTFEGKYYPVARKVISDDPPKKPE